MDPRPWPDGRTPVLLASHAEDLLAADATALTGYLDRTAVDPAALAAHLLATRRIRRHRAVIRAADRTELRAGLDAVAAGTEHPLVSRGTELPNARVAFVFPGQGGQWPGMGADAYTGLADYRAAADECGGAFAAAGLVSPVRYLTGDDRTAFAEIEVEGAQFVHHIALAAVWRAHGVLPDITIGHSLGEVAAAHLAGALTLPDAIRIVATRASVVGRLTGDYAVAALGISAAAALELIAATPGWLELAVVNAENSVAVAGERSAVRMAVAEVRGHGALARDITVNFPVHTSVLEPLRDALHPDWPPGVFSDTAVQFIGGTTGAVVAAGTPFPDYWYRNLRDTVRFDRAVESAVGLGAGTFVEMSAHPALLFATAAVLGERPAVLVGSGRRDAALPDVLAAGLATVAASDPAYRWRTLHRSAGGGLRDVPGTAMRTDSFWLAPAPEPAAGPVVTIAAETWIEVFAAQPQSATTVAVVALGAEVLGGTMRAAAQQHRGARVVPVEDAELLIVLAPDGLDDPDPVTAAEALASLIGSGLLRYPTAIGNRCRTVCLVTVRAEQVSTIDPPARPGQAALAAMHRSVGREHPGVTFDQLDLPSTDADPIPVLDAVLGSTGTRALRTVADRPVLVRRSMIEVPGTPESRVSLDEVVITGGSGGIAGHCVRILAARGARRIVLLGRRELDPSTLAALRGGHDTELVSVPCDLRDPHAVAAAATTYGGAGAALVIHTAGTGQFHAAAELDTADVADGFGAKVIGLANLTRYWPLRDDARILLCSSVSGLWGGSGHAAYGAANRVLDVMAAQLRAAGRDCSALRFGLWDAPSAIVDDAQTVNITRSGLRPMPPAAAVEAMLAGLPGDPLIYAADAKRLATFLDAGSAAQPDPPGADAATVLQAELAAVLDLGDGPVDLGESLFDLGVDSLLAVELRNRLKGRLGRTVTLATLLSGVTGNQIVAELEQQKVDHA